MSAGYLRRCAGKQPFATKDAGLRARTALAASQGKNKDSLNVYLCDQCLKYHVGGTSRQFASRNRTGRRPNKKMRGRA